MRTISLISTLLLLFTFTSCSISKTKLSKDGAKVKVHRKKPAGCNVLNKVIGVNENGSPALAKNHARNLAADNGGTAITFDEEVPNGNTVKIYATVYQCI